MILPDIAFNGVINFGVYQVTDNSFDGGQLSNAKGAAIRFKYEKTGTQSGTRNAGSTNGVNSLVSQVIADDTPALSNDAIKQVFNDSRPFIYQGASYREDSTTKKMTQFTANNGHLGCIDSPACIDRLYGVNAYSATPTPFAMGKA